jgi:hemerythrin-like metal-binding protein
MHAIEWSDTYLIGIPELDDEHRRIVAMINAVIAAVEVGLVAKTVLDMIDGMMAVVLPHMATEQNMMKPLASPQGIGHRRKHIAGHAEFIRQINAVRAELAAGDDCKVSLDRLTVFLTVLELRAVQR